MTVRLCDIEGCVAPHKARGLCQKHYNATPERKAKHDVANARWRTTPEGKALQAAARTRWRATTEGRALDNASDVRFRVSAKGRAAAERTWASVVLKHAIKAGAAIGDVPADTRAILRVHFGEKCLVPGCVNVATDVDHIVALAGGGIHDISNFQPLCGPCNKAKGTKTIDYRPAT